MDIIGIIAEYNPFHNGHIYHIETIRKMYPASIIVLVLNGYFLERGEISILSKEDKVKIALENNVNIVLELPFLYGTQSADTFANESIKLLNKLNVNKIIFGSECNDVNMLTKIAKEQLKTEFNEKVKTYLDKGVNYPTALAKAIDTKFTYNPNDLLGISYIKAIIQNNFDITPITIKRTSNYHDLTSNSDVISASNIRSKLSLNEDISKYLPKEVIDKFIRIDNDTFFKLLKAKIITDDVLNEYLDVDEGIEYRLKKYINESSNIDDYIEKVKTKRYTYNKLNRMFIHILVGLKKQSNIENANYLKVLGFDKIGKKYLKNIKVKQNFKNTSIYDLELKASLIYDLINNTSTYSYEIKNKPVIKN